MSTAVSFASSATAEKRLVERSDTWFDVGCLDDIPRRGARCVRFGDLTIALFRTAQDEVFALEDRCPHKAGPLSQGIVHDRSVTCPLHNWVISLADGQAQGADAGRTDAFTVRLEGKRILLEVRQAALDTA